jgi:hypothetical protein
MARNFGFGTSGHSTGGSPVCPVRVAISSPLQRRLHGSLLGHGLAPAHITGLLRHQFPSSRSGLFGHTTLGHDLRFS